MKLLVLPMLLLFGYIFVFTIFGGACSWNPLASVSIERGNVLGETYLSSLEHSNYTFPPNSTPRFCVCILSGQPRTFHYLEATLAAFLKHAKPVYELRIFIETDLESHPEASRASRLGIPVSRLPANVCSS